jgi:excisionase family DNA binding protein
MDCKTLTVEQVAKVLGISRGSAYEAVRVGQIPSIRMGRRLLISKSALDELLSGSMASAGTSLNPSTSSSAPERMGGSKKTL